MGSKQSQDKTTADIIDGLIVGPQYMVDRQGNVIPEGAPLPVIITYYDGQGNATRQETQLSGAGHVPVIMLPSSTHNWGAGQRLGNKSPSPPKSA